MNLILKSICFQLIVVNLEALYINLIESKIESNENCLNDWINLNNEKCIHLSKFKLNYEESKSYCKLNYNANRLIIENESKQKLIQNYLANLNSTDQQVNNEIKIWIGLNRINLKSILNQDESILLWDDEFESINRLINQFNDEKNKISVKKLELNHSDESIKNENIKNENDKRTNSIVLNEITKSKEQNKQSNDHYQRAGLINLKDFDEKFHLTNLLNLEDQIISLISNRSLIKFDNRFRFNQVDSHFFITDRQIDNGKWKMSFSPSIKYLTICELPISQNKPNSKPKTYEREKCKSKWYPIYLDKTNLSNYECIRFINLYKSVKLNEIKEICKNELINHSSINGQSQRAFELKSSLNNKVIYSDFSKITNVDIFKMSNINEFKQLIKLIEFESIEIRNAGWIIQLNDSTNFNDFFEHKPLFNDSCFQILPRHVIRKRNIVIDTHFLHEFNCNEPTDELFTICSYSQLKRIANKVSHTIDNRTRDKLVKQDRSQHQRSMMNRPNKIDILNTKIDSNSNEHNRIVEETRDEIIKRSYLITFDLFIKLLLIFILINLIIFSSICYLSNRNSNSLATPIETTHVHFENYDNSLKFAT